MATCDPLNLYMVTTSLDSVNFYFLLAVFQGFVLVGLILLNKPLNKPHLYFGLLILIYSLSLLHLVLVQSIHAFNAKYPIPMDLSLAYGPLAYLHVVSLKKPKRKWQWSELFHFLPTLLIDVILFSAFFIYAGSYMNWVYANLEKIQTVALIISLLSLIQFSIYSMAAFKKFWQDRDELKEFLKIKSWLNWLFFSWACIIIFLLIVIPASLVNLDKLDDHAYMLYNPFGVIMGLSIYGLGYLYLLRYRKIVDAYLDRIDRFGFSDEELFDRKKILLEILLTQQIYKDPEISVTKLAQQIGWPTHELSFLINEGFRTNFNDWINHHRIEAFKALLQLPENKKYSVVGLSQEVGFSSKASFYRAFKKATGLTPSDYLKSNDQK